ncbi:hypothetical protein [Vibrio rumoiensis]|uniref:Uncharacterized protein n=1 Tax=Vibrio rumoiensis 1S-45 TaxID=1188252 RepID=A0A1E5E2M7_9VIBR|nr:hypothetical protein [Vibrio rumoiensis]OEF25782.1 hypothetical protein A1QC_08435 [Vibrio rumoiensis 1S-45]
MIELTPQEHALATFKSNLHLPNNGFHTLIVDLAREFQLPFQSVRKVLKQSQKVIEKKIKHDFENVVEQDLTQANWIQLIRNSLTILAQDNVPLMESLKQNKLYTSVIDALDKPLENETTHEELLENLAMVYEVEVYKSLAAMLYTSILYWKLSDDLFQMTEDKQQALNGYPQHIEATVHLLDLAEKVKLKSNS